MDSVLAEVQAFHDRSQTLCPSTKPSEMHGSRIGARETAGGNAISAISDSSLNPTVPFGVGFVVADMKPPEAATALAQEAAPAEGAEDELRGRCRFFVIGDDCERRNRA